MPASLLAPASPGEVKDHSRKIIELCKEGGGFILAAGTNSVEGANIDNLRAMVEAAAEYGVYAK